MRIRLCSVVVDDQQRALDFYTGTLGFLKSQDFPVGEFRWITVKSPEGGDAELALEPNANPDARAFQEAMFRQGIPFTAFEVDDLDSEFDRLRELGVVFTTEPTPVGIVSIAVFADTCGNLIQIYESIEQPPVTDHAETAGQ